MSSSSNRRPGRLPSFRGSYESSSSSSAASSSAGGDLVAGKHEYHILMMGPSRCGKTSLVKQFLYDVGPREEYKDTCMGGMYRGEFEINNQVG